MRRARNRTRRHEVLLEILLISTFVVVCLSLISEHISPRAAGLISGAPTGSAITLFFLGMSRGEQFAADSAIYNMVGMIGMQALLYCYYKASKHFKTHTVILSSLAGICGYAIVVWLLHLVPMGRELAVALPLLSIALFAFLFKEIENVKIEKKAHLGAGMLLARAIAASVIIVAIVTASEAVGPAWTGLFSSFPTTLFPLILITHFTYGAKPVHTIMKNVPFGLPALVAFSLTVSVAYPVLGIYWGTAAAFAAAICYLAAYVYLVQGKARSP